jgi:hypothetical protein
LTWNATPKTLRFTSSSNILILRKNLVAGAGFEPAAFRLRAYINATLEIAQ